MILNRHIAEDELDGFVRGFEESYARDGRAEMAAHLPPAGHPIRALVLRELVRVDLEFCHDRGTSRGLDVYVGRFPELLDDPEGLSEIMHEQDRLRRQAEGAPREDATRRQAPRPGGGDTPGYALV